MKLTIKNEPMETKVLGQIRFGNIVMKPESSQIRYLLVDSDVNDDVVHLIKLENGLNPKLATLHMDVLMVDCGPAEIISPK